MRLEQFTQCKKTSSPMEVYGKTVITRLPAYTQMVNHGLKCANSLPAVNPAVVCWPELCYISSPVSKNNNVILLSLFTLKEVRAKASAACGYLVLFYKVKVWLGYN